MPTTGKTAAEIVEGLRRWLILQQDAKLARWSVELREGKEYTITHSEEASGEIVLEGEVVT